MKLVRYFMNTVIYLVLFTMPLILANTAFSDSFFAVKNQSAYFFLCVVIAYPVVYFTVKFNDWFKSKIREGRK